MYPETTRQRRESRVVSCKSLQRQILFWNNSIQLFIAFDQHGFPWTGGNLTSKQIFCFPLILYDLVVLFEGSA